jgi:hypothetical protein
MHLPPRLPDIAFVRVCTAGGPYQADDILSVAFNAPGVGRLAPHVPNGRSTPPRSERYVVPESITAIVTISAGPYAVGDYLTLSFVDPAIARILPVGFSGSVGEHRARWPEATDEPAVPEDALLLETVGGMEGAPASPDAMTDAETALAWSSLMYESDHDSQESEVGSPTGVRVTLTWSPERAQRFVRVVDKLFTVDRLGWYRHVLAVRLLVPDEIATGDAPADIDAGRQLRALRAAVAETLGRPLLAACMPNFSITTEWLDQLDDVGAARAIGGLRDAMLPFVDDETRISARELAAGRTIGIVTRSELLASPPASVEALLPVLIPCLSPLVALGEKLAGYRGALIDGFNQTAGSAKAVRLNAMSHSNPALDDRLWQLAGTIGETFGAFSAS